MNFRIASKRLSQPRQSARASKRYMTGHPLRHISSRVKPSRTKRRQCFCMKSAPTPTCHATSASTITRGYSTPYVMRWRSAAIRQAWAIVKGNYTHLAVGGDRFVEEVIAHVGEGATHLRRSKRLPAALQGGATDDLIRQIVAESLYRAMY